MRYLFLLAALVAVTAQAAPTPEQEAFKAYLLSGKEPKVKDATWMTDTNLYVGMIDDGSSRDGFAQYLCQAAQDHGVQADLIKIVDAAKVLREKKFVEIGSTYCPKISEPETEVKF